LRVGTSRNFGPYFAGNALSASGTWFQNLAASLLVYRQTHSAFLLGVLNFAQFAPILLLAPWTGSIADRFDRRRLLLVAQGASAALAAALAALAWGGLAPTSVVIAFGLALGVVSASSIPAQQALVPSLVPVRDLTAAVALNSMTYNLARALGPALAALVVATLGIPAAFLLNAGSFLIFALCLVLVRPRPQQRASGGAGLRESLALLRREPRLAVLLFVVAAVGFASDPVNTEAPAFAHAFGHPDTWAGLVIGAFGAGAVTAAIFTAGHVGSPARTARMMTLLGAGVILFAVGPWLGLGFVFLFLAGFGYLSANTRATTQLQLSVEEGQRGRIMALWSIAFLGLRPLASLLDGAVAGVLGVRTAGVLLAVPALAGAAWIALRLRR
jgi:MFS family permease